MDSERKSRKTGLKPFLWGVTLGAGVTATALLMQRADPPPVPAEAPRPPPAEPCVEAKPAEATLPKEAKDFAFYDVLEKAPVTPARPDLEQPPMPPAPAVVPVPAPRPAPVPPAPQPQARTSFYLQIASFRAEADAEALKARIVLSGVAAVVVAMDLPDKGTYYRVRLGPFASQEEAEQAKAQLVEDGVELDNAFPVR